ncbi:hypothetical protein METBIDRAFT_45884 [Metschnikowia bicuspidata var. bicuspidata NRRL YB-4993]|uniref:Uncharacterized protein n=1 Tax=Metschnikowia bicuspidata var. bicuspidata NRRL YB-4993 TaxID=869754 RepID=A0A1A0H6H1_9ASCO|nr:hypothetical protein METBIDRAFT_45884 [Metschnikowia bicuspidata var. bicuspidata NRRL YB-4993]OBA19560.1 hypothetical protein METBIDRAFT_45884 [Metschnikowia bicuspidata var. bicuspidata NRRL YB-4993]
MPNIHSVEHHLNRRYFYASDWSGGARWAFFAIFIAIIVICVIGTIRVNKKRSRQGIQPIYGTRWMTPPSYFQSQDQYNQPARGDADIPTAYVPTYTEQANANDMGYYAPDGTFYPNPNSKGPIFPESAHHRTTSNADGQPLLQFDQNGVRVFSDEMTEDFTRPTGPPSGMTGISRDDTAPSSVDIYERPGHPPPGAR